MSSSSQASQRINALLDENSFVEIGALVTARNTDFNLKQEDTPDAPVQQAASDKKPNAWLIKKEQEKTERKRLSRISKIEQRLGEIGEEKNAVSAQLAAPETASDYEKILDLTARLEALEAEEGSLENEWLELNG